jgi:uncharacterized protein YdeI (YjbR/CyaY-like superfamily)
MKGKKQDLPLVQPKSRTVWRAWLEKNHASSSGIWLVYAKKHTGIPSLTYADAVEEALCFGWIDSLVHPIDDSLYKQIFTPRTQTSRWSALNKKRVERLIVSRQMTAAGMKMIELAKTSGLWNAHAQTDALTMPPMLKRALDDNAAAKKNWPTYTESQRKGFLRMVADAKTDQTRAKRIARVIDILERRVRFADLLKRPPASRAPAKAPSRRPR